MFYYVYVLFSIKDRRLYIGFTSDLKNRIKKHDEGGNTSTRHRRPLKLIYSEAYINEQDARKREIFFKTGHGREELKRILNNTLVDIAGIV